MLEKYHFNTTANAEVNEEPVIKLPTDPMRVKQLEAKKAEYIRRLDLQAKKFDRYAHPDLSQHPSTRMKLYILNEVLEEGEVPMWTLSVEFAEHHEGLITLMGAERFTQEWDIAAFVIEDYCETGGIHVDGGTGLRQN